MSRIAKTLLKYGVLLLACTLFGAGDRMLLIDLCLTIPIQQEALPVFMPRLMRVVVTALSPQLNAQEEVLHLALRSLEVGRVCFCCIV